jgi:hypothetical protein
LSTTTRDDALLLSLDYILFRKGETTSLQGIRFIKEGTMNANDDEPTTATPTADDVSNIVSSQLQQKKLGNFVYSLTMFDMIAAKVMKISSSTVDVEGGSSSGIQPYTWAYTASHHDPPSSKKIMNCRNQSNQIFTT